MVTISTAALAILLRLQPDELDATEPDRAGRLATVADAMALATGDPVLTRGRRAWTGTREELVAALLTVGEYESHFAHRIHVAQCLRHECDAYTDASGVRRHRARSLWQMHDTALVVGDWHSWTDTSLVATLDAAVSAGVIMSRARRVCWEDPATWFSYYGTGSVCRPTKWWPQAEKRRATYRSRLTRLRAELLKDEPAD